MKLTIKLLPPYRKKGDPDQQVLHLDMHSINLEQLSWYLAKNWGDKLNYSLLDDNKLLTAEFMVNGKSASLERVVQDGDRVTVVPYICGG